MMRAIDAEFSFSTRRVAVTCDMVLPFAAGLPPDDLPAVTIRKRWR
jgi:hypothetical protein